MEKQKIPSLVSLPIGTILTIQDYSVEQKYGLDNIIITDTNNNKYNGGWFLLDQKEKIQKGESLVRLDRLRCPRVGNKNKKHMSCTVFQKHEWWHSVSPMDIKCMEYSMPKTSSYVCMMFNNNALYKEEGQVYKMHKNCKEYEKLCPCKTESSKTRGDLQRQEVRERKIRQAEELFERKKEILAIKKEMLETKKHEIFKKKMVKHLHTADITNFTKVPNDRYIILACLIRTKKCYDTNLNTHYDKKSCIVVLHPVVGNKREYDILKLILVINNNLMDRVNSNKSYLKQSSVFLSKTGSEVEFLLDQGGIRYKIGC